MLKAMLLSAMISGNEILPRDNPKIKNAAIASTVIVVANLLMYSPIIIANLNKE
jgi:hypothetical protein